MEGAGAVFSTPGRNNNFTSHPLQVHFFQEKYNSMTDQEVRFLPFHAVNDFMREDFRQDVVRQVLQALPQLPNELRAMVDRQTKRSVRVPGFRSGDKAPVAMRIRPTADAFEKSPQLVGAILSAWASAHAELRTQIYDLLISRGWEVFPPDADRTRLPGFITRWPAGEDFEGLNTAYLASYPSGEQNTDVVSLMVVWISMRLPYQLDEDIQTSNSD